MLARVWWEMGKVSGQEERRTALGKRLGKKIDTLVGIDANIGKVDSFLC